MLTNIKVLLSTIVLMAFFFGCGNDDSDDSGIDNVKLKGTLTPVASTLASPVINDDAGIVNVKIKGTLTPVASTLSLPVINETVDIKAGSEKLIIASLKATLPEVKLIITAASSTNRSGTVTVMDGITTVYADVNGSGDFILDDLSAIQLLLEIQLSQL